MKKIIISINNDTLIFKLNTLNNKKVENLMDTNIISDNELIFSYEYIQDNGKILGLFIKEIIDERHIRKIVIDKFEMFSLLEPAFKYFDKLDTLYISDENNFTFEAYEIIIRLDQFNKINCYSIPTYMIEMFDKHGIKVISRAEILFTSNFMEDNNLTSYSKIYYKSSVKISPPVSEQDVNDFRSFCKVNKYLRTIHFDACSLNALDAITNIIIDNILKNTRIVIHDNIISKDLIGELKRRKKLYARNRIHLELKYTDEYVKENYARQIVITVLTACAIIALLILGGSTLYVLSNNKISEKNVALISEQIENKIAEDNLNREKISEEVIEDPSEPRMIPKMNSLLDLNPDTVGWLTVPGTNIDYPVVRTDNNDFYLNHNFNKDRDYNGWVFMHYENTPQNLDKNTILFAHNRYHSGVMFGTLSKVTEEKWLKEANNIRIFYDTLYEEGEYEVFSVYKIYVTDDYLTTTFQNDSEWLDFLDMIRERSLFKSDAVVGVDDKIITLSTCLENNRRLVVHAVKRN